jgi:hypothetical protein
MAKSSPTSPLSSFKELVSTYNDTKHLKLLLLAIKRKYTQKDIFVHYRYHDYLQASSFSKPEKVLSSPSETARNNIKPHKHLPPNHIIGIILGAGTLHRRVGLYAYNDMYTIGNIIK